MPDMPGWLIWVARSVVGITLVLSGLAKVRDMAAFARGVREYGILPDALTAPFASTLALSELTIGFLLLLGLLSPWPAVGALALFALFGVAVLVNLSRGRDLPCYCMGASSRERIGLGTVLRLIVLAALTAVAIGPNASILAAFPEVTNVRDDVALVSLVFHSSIFLALIGPTGLVLGQVVKSRRGFMNHKKAVKSRVCSQVVYAEPISVGADLLSSPDVDSHCARMG